MTKPIFSEGQDINMDAEQSKARILIVDDEPMNLHVLSLGLKAQDYEVFIALDGDSALESARENSPDIVLLDVRMPGMDGYETCQVFKADDQLQAIPIIFISAENATRSKVRALQAGGVDYVTKPFIFDEVLARVDAQLKISRQQKEIRRLYEQLNRHAQFLEEQVEQRTAELRQAKEQVEVILDNVNDVLVLVKTDGVLQKTNPAFGQVLGFESERALNLSLTALFVADQMDLVNSALASVIQTRLPKRIDAIARRQNGTTFDIDLSLSPILDGTGQVIGLVASLRDISQQKQLEHSLRQSLQRERDLGALKSRFIETVSHEFRTPMAVIQSSGEMLASYYHKMSDQERVEKIERIQSGIQRMVTVLDDVLAADITLWRE
jgi:PAS domain S-box-containing protein